MAERSRAYVSDAFAHIPPWCKRQHTGLWNLWSWFESRRRSLAAARRIDFPLHSIRCLLYRTYNGPGVTQAAKRRHALVAQWIERPPPERKATSPILVEGTHENSANHNARSPLLLFSLKPSRLVRVRASRGNALVAQRIERRFPKPGAAGPTPAKGTSAAFDGLTLSKNRNHWSPDRPPL